MVFKRGKPTGPIKKVGPARGLGHDCLLSSRLDDFPKVEFDAALIRERLEIVSYIHKGVRVTFENEADRHGRKCSSTRRACPTS